MIDEDITQLFCPFKSGFVDSYVSPCIKLEYAYFNLKSMQSLRYTQKKKRYTHTSMFELYIISLR